MSNIATVRARLELRLVVPGGPSLPVPSELHYAAADPWAVRVEFETGGEGDGIVTWLFARQLLADGLAGEAGEGDVQVRPAESEGERVVQLAMSSPSGSALFEILRDDVAEFLQQTYLAVPTGCEGDAVDLDAELAGLLRER